MVQNGTAAMCASTSANLEASQIICCPQTARQALQFVESALGELEIRPCDQVGYDPRDKHFATSGPT